MVLSLSAFISQDLLSGVVGHNMFDVFYVAQVCFKLLYNHEILEIKTPEQLKNFVEYVIWSYRQLRVFLKQNLKYLRKVQEALLMNDDHLDAVQIQELLSGISCPIDPASNYVKCPK